MKWCIAIVNIKFFFDFLVPRNLDNTLLKLCELILPNAYFSGCTMVWFYELHYRDQKVTAIRCVHWSFKFWVFSGACRQKLTVKWQWLKFFLEPVSFVCTVDKFMTNGWQTGQPSLATLTMNGFTRNAKHGFNSWKWSNLAWSSSSRLTIYFCILPLCGPVIASSQKNVCSLSDIPKLTECIWQHVSFKKFNFLLGAQEA